MRMPYKLRSTIDKCTYKYYKHNIYGNLQRVTVTGRKKAVFDMSTLVPSRRLVDLLVQLDFAGFDCLLLYRNYLSYLKTSFLRNLRYSEIVFNIGSVIDHMPKQYELLVTKKPAKGFRTDTKKVLEVDDMFIDGIEAIAGNKFYYPIHFHPKYFNEHIEAETQTLRLNEKKIGVLFAGNSNINYAKNNKLFHDCYGIHSRFELLDYLRKECSDLVVEPESEEQFNTLLKKGQLKHKIVLIDKFSISGIDESTGYNKYFELLSMAKYYLYTTGVIIPFCHNHIESIACGCIPITEFPQFYPNMADNKNCIVFKSLTELNDKVRDALSHEEQNVVSIESIFNYYDDNFSLRNFDQKINEYLSDTKPYETYFMASIK